MKRSILYFDPDASSAHLLQRVFGGEYDVRAATSFAEARRMLSTGADVLISKQGGPETRATALLREAARTCPSSFRVLLTDEPVPAEAIHEVSIGVIHIFIPRPWTVEKMRQALELAELQSGWQQKVQ